MLLLVGTTSMAQSYYVDAATGSDANSGSQWNTVSLVGPFKTIGKALSTAAALSAGTTANIYVKQNATAYSMSTTAYTFSNMSLLLQGGFPTAATGTDVSGYAASNTTTISYSGAPSPALAVNNTGAGPYTVTIKGFTQNGLTGGNFFNAITATEANTTFAFTDMTHTSQTCATMYDLENLTASNTISFNNVSLNNISNSGGVIRLVNAAKTVNLTTVTLNACTTSAANYGNIYLTGNSASPMLNIASDCVFTNNSCGGNNGGLFNVLSNTGSFVLSNINTPISGNKAGSGGAIFFYTGNTGGITISNVTFSGNSATGNGGAIYYYTTVAATPTISNVNFIGNTASGSGGAISGSGTTITTTGSNFCNNTSGAGGAIYSNGGPVNLDNCIFNNNSTTSAGGAVQAAAALTITNSSFSTNSASSSGGAIQTTGASTYTNTKFYGNYSGNAGGAINTNATVTISACNFTKNYALSVGAIQVANAITINGTGNIFDANYCTNASGAGAINASSITGIANTIFRNNYINSSASNNAVAGSDIGAGIPGSFVLNNSSMQRSPLTLYTSGLTTGSNSTGNAATFTAATAPTGCTAIVLPITLSSFTGVANGCTASLKWITATELNSNCYMVEASVNGSSYTPISKVTSKNSTTGASYSYEAPMASGTNYFRVKAVDNDSKFTYSPVVAVMPTGACGTGMQVRVSPNPTKDVVNVQGLPTGSTVTMLGINGQQITSIIAAGTNQSINIGSFANGIYVLRILAPDGSVSNVKVIKE